MKKGQEMDILEEYYDDEGHYWIKYSVKYRNKKTLYSVRFNTPSDEALRRFRKVLDEIWAESEERSEMHGGNNAVD
ncbi:hypothetical protein [Paenibacillus tianjinensis]|uniref:Uncharacterized protein n=1 Tax=Paenibacillus tianjinensis TaxID=2810347 RepID=A0ABX7L5Y7_9BACL|nr:hypothetical protein [Paenibacillus tianjinensis]QSF43297.1 hypothetical protein JRJ22_18695 [Paenibacillus tianjinensis]